MRKMNLVNEARAPRDGKEVSRILILTTGGTIASKPTPTGLIPQYDGAELLDYLRVSPEHYEVVVKDILQLDSSNLQATEWQLIARSVAENHAGFDGIVITHGTDTMAYTAAALSYMLRNFPKPVVLTGSQLPIHHPLTDALSNLDLALAMASTGVPGVFLAFADKVILGTRGVKVRTLDFEAFDSINLPPIARANSIGLDFDPHVLAQCEAYYDPQKPFCLKDQISTDVILLKLTPGLRPELFDELPRLGYKAIYIEAFGIGGIHYLHHDLHKKIAELISDGMHVVVGSQCLYERSDFSIYETGRKLLEIGAIEAFDMTSEAAFVKLMWSLANAPSPEAVPALFLRDLAGELRLSKSYEVLRAEADPEVRAEVLEDSDR